MEYVGGTSKRLWLVRILVLWFVNPEACTYSISLCYDVGAWFIIDCLPYEWRSGMSDGHFLPIYPPRGMWYISNVSIIFDCSMLYYLLFWTLLGFIIHFYIIFGTNLLTGGPAQNCYFLPVLGFWRKGISNRFQTEWNLRKRDFLMR